MLNFASICPHPPIIIPGVGNEKDLEKCSKTIEAMRTLASYFKKQKIDSAVVIMPHGQLLSDKFAVYNSKSFTTSLPGALLCYDGDQDLSRKILKIKETEEVKQGNINYSFSVPLYYLKQEIPSFKVVPINYSGRSIEDHFQFGKKLYSIIEKEEKRIGIIASGDFSHKLTPSAPAGFSKKGKEFDQNIINLLKDNKVKKILDFDQNLISEAGQCAYLSIVTLLGALSTNNTEPDLLSYQGPFGVGYGVVNYKIKNEN
jgi:AmmeMemoRadiSam system protein B